MSTETRQTPVPTPTTPVGGYCRLRHYGVVRVTGRDASEFLNRQLTFDLDAVSPELSGFGALCTHYTPLFEAPRYI